jgi:hypothetical protein
MGIYGLFFYHFLLFMALRLAPPVSANLVNYLWPLLMVVLAPVILPGVRLSTVHVLAALLGFAGAAVVILGGDRSVALGHGGGKPLGLPAGRRGGLHLVELLIVEQAGGGLSNRRHRQFCTGLRRVVAAVPCAAGACQSL